MLTYILFQTQGMLLSATRRKGQPDADLHPVQIQEDALVRNKQGRKGQPDADLPPVQNPEHTLVSSRQERPARCWLTSCSRPRPRSCQQQAGRASQMLAYSLFKTKRMLLLETSKKEMPDADLHTVQNPEHTLVSNKKERPARCWLTYCSKPRGCSCWKQVRKTSQILTYILSQPRACSCQYQRMPSKILTYVLFTIKAHFCQHSVETSSMLAYSLFRYIISFYSRIVK